MIDTSAENIIPEEQIIPTYQMAASPEPQNNNKSTLEAIMQLNKNAWDKSCEEYSSFCKAYYVNLVLTNRF